jgi:dihydroxyacetone kinase-like protein
VGVTRAALIAWLAALQRAYAENRAYLTDLDAAIGDADHGINMERGFSAVKAELDRAAPDDISGTLKAVAGVLLRSVGGASGPLYGTFFLRASAACAGKTELQAGDVVAMIEAGLAGVAQRGKASPGDKTMVDALSPALAAMQAAQADGAGLARILEQGVAAAERGMKDTVPLQARKGRASYLGERSIGHQDPGATSAYLLLKAAADSWRDG